ncbi:MAG: phage late control D family protein, partial [Candidatus Accumulibacter sp.]|nr:phage late control D family protein [Accumulibacter sp.]
MTIESPVSPQHRGRPGLVAVKVEGKEGIGELFGYDVILKTPEDRDFVPGEAADIDLDGWIGQEARLEIELEGSGFAAGSGAGQSGGESGRGAGIREINGLIAEACFLREEGRHVFYRITLKPWLHLATLTSDCKIYQDVTVVELLDALLSDYGYPVEKRLTGSYPRRDYQTQYDETDYVFFCRLCEEWGIQWYFEHRDGAHRLVLIDEMSAYQKNRSAAYWDIPFHALGDKIDEEYIHAFVAARRIVPGRYVTRDYDYTRPKSELETRQDDPRPTAHGGEEIYEWHAATSGGSHYAQPKAGPGQESNHPEEEGGRLARLRMESLRSPGHRARGAGQLRGLLPGHVFTLRGHP